MNPFRKWLVAVLLAGGFPAAVPAQQYNIFHNTLDNGLEVIVIENPIVPLATIEIDVRNGAFTETPEYAGLSHLYEHMFFKANAAYPDGGDFLERTGELGMSWNATTHEEVVNYFFTLPKDNVRAGMEFMSAAIRSPLFLEDELVRERQVVIGEYDRQESNPFFHLVQAVNKKLWYKYFSHKNMIGDRQIILTADREKMQTIQRRYYVPNNSALLVAGDVKHEKIFKWAKKIFSGWPRGADPFVEFPAPDHPPLQKSELVIVEKPVNAVTILINLHGPSVRRDPQATYAADVFSYILSQPNSQFYQQLVDSGLLTSVGFSYYTLDKTGPITLLAQTTADNYATATKAIWAQIEKFTEPDYYTDAQLANSKHQLEINEIYSHEKPSTYVHTIGFWWSVASLEYYLGYIDNLRRVTREDINAYVRRYIQNAPYIMGVLVSPEDRKKLSLEEGKAL
ncbi:MAG: putative zinc protease [bacterium]|nr:putative zinc protease [bacterium]